MKKGCGNQKIILHRINKLALSLIARSVTFLIGANATFQGLDIFKIIVYASIRKMSVEGSSEELMHLCKDAICSADVVQRRIHQKTEQEIMQDFQRVQQLFLSILRKRRLLFRRVTIAIDFTDKLYYGDKNDAGIVGTKHQRGTSYCFRYITLNVVVGEVKIALMSLPVKPFADKAKLVHILLSWAEENKIRIGLVLLDRGFFSKKVIKVLQEHEVRFLLPVPKNELVKKMIKDAHKDKEYCTIYIIKRGRKVIGSFNMFFILNPDVKDQEIWKQYRVFGTNLPVTNANREVFAEMYRKRWGIETSFRLEKHDFLAETTSKSYVF